MPEITNSRRVHLSNAGVLKSCEDFRFVPEPPQRFLGNATGVKEFHRDVAVGVRLSGFEDDPHPAKADALHQLEIVNLLTYQCGGICAHLCREWWLKKARFVGVAGQQAAQFGPIGFIVASSLDELFALLRGQLDCFAKK